MHTSSVPAVEHSEDSPRHVHSPQGMHRQSMPVSRAHPSRSRRNRITSSVTEDAHVEVTRAVGPADALLGVAEAPQGVGDALAAAREDYRSSRRALVQRSDSALLADLSPLHTHQD